MIFARINFCGFHVFRQIPENLSHSLISENKSTQNFVEAFFKKNNNSAL